MGGKGKLYKFAEVHKFDNVIEPFYDEIVGGFNLKGKWNEMFFKNDNPIVLELACGKGEYTVGLAERNPEINYIGLDVKGARMWRGASTAIEKGLKNAAFLRIQINLIEHCFAQNEISEIWITFPDPQPRKPKERKRLTSPNFLNKYRNIIKADGFIHLKTDNIFLFDYTLEVIKNESHNLIEFSRDIHKSELHDDIKSIKTFYEKMFLDEGMPILYLKFKL